MEIFEGQTPVDSEVKEVTTEDNQLSFVDQLVGEGKKFKDVEALARGKAESDRLIAELQTKQAEQDHAKSLLDKLQEKATVAPVTPEPKQESPEGKENTTLKPEDVTSLLEDALAKRDQETIVKNNLKIVQEALVSAHGTEAQAVVLSKAKELNVPAEFLDDMASKSPEAFLTLMGTPPSKPSPSLVQTNTNTSSVVPSQKDARYYHKMLTENPKMWKSVAIQNEMRQEKQRQGDSFFN